MNKKSCVLCRNFISIYKINRTLHGRLGIRILSSSAESISQSFASLARERYFQHSKIKFVSSRGHVISSIFRANLQKMKNDLITREFKNLNCHEIKKERKNGKIEDVVDSKKKTETQSFLPYE